MNLVKNIILQIIDFLDENLKTKKAIEISKLIKNESLEENNFIYQVPSIPPKAQSLKRALDSITLDSLTALKQSIISATTGLRWNIDNGDFYSKNSQIGESYLSGNMNTELIGPKNGVFRSDELRLGLFLLEPNIFYKDHKHRAPELYLNLTNGTMWRFEDMNWVAKQAGSLIYNKSNEVHAMKVGSEPFLSIWCWPNNLNEKCILVPRKDWATLDTELKI